MTASAVAHPTPKVSEEARVAMRGLGDARRNQTSPTITVVAGHAAGAPVAIPAAAFDLLLEILGQMANGNAVTIVPVHAELTTQQAADVLNVSRPFLIQLLEAGAITHRKVGTHRRIRFADLMKYKQQDDAQRRGVMDELASEAQTHGLAYDNLQRAPRSSRHQFVSARHINEANDDERYLSLTPAERVGLVWPLTVQAWTVMLAARGETFDAQSRFQGDHLGAQLQRR